MGQVQQVRVGAILHASVLLAGGFAVTFTQHLHHVLGFNAWLFSGFAVLFAVVHLSIRTRTSNGAEGRGAARPGSTLIAIASLAAAAGSVAAALTLNAPLFIVVLLTWAAVIAVIDLLPRVRTANRESLVLGVLAALLALSLLFLARDVTMAVGLFCAYCILAGVYLGIGAFDRSPIHAGRAASAASENGL